MVERHFAFFRQSDGTYTREWQGPVASYRPGWWDVVPFLRTLAMTRWATRVSQPRPGEVGLDVTPIKWPVGDFCYCTLDLHQPKPMLDWGPPRHYIEVKMDTLEIVANQESHRPIRDAVSGQRVLDITGTWLEAYHGNIFGRFVQRGEQWALEPVTGNPETQRALEAGTVDLDLAVPLTEKDMVLA